MSRLREDIRDSLVQAGQKACGYMNCKLFVQTVTGIPKLDELPSRPFRSIGDLITGDVLKWGTGRHWAIYIGNGDIMEVEEWGAESRTVPLAEVLEEMDPPDTVFSTVTPQREGLLREYINDTLLEEAEVGALMRDVDDILDDAIRDAAPEIVRDIREREVDEDIDEFIDGALHGSWDTRELSYADVPNVGDNAEVRDEGDSIEVTEMYRLGYQWGWDNPGKIDSAENVPAGIRREMVEYALENFKTRVTEEFVINAMEKATAYVKKQMGDVHDILKKAKEKFGWKVAPAIVGIEVVEHAVLPSVLGAIHPIFYGLAAVPTVEILVASALAIAKARMPSVAKAELPPGHLDWYESEYGKAVAESLLREYVREKLIMEDPMGFVQDLAGASNEFGEEGEMFFGGNPGKGGGKAIKRAFANNADHTWLATLNTVHWKDPYILDKLQNSNKDELSTSMSLPGDNLLKSIYGDVGLWVKGRITLATNDQDNLYSGNEGDYRPKMDADQEELRKYLHKKDSSGINKLPTVSKDYSMYGNLKPGNEYSEKLARNIPYVLDQSTWDPSQTRSSTNEALVDNWKAVGIVAGKDDLAKSVKAMADQDWAIEAIGITRKIFMLARDYGVPIYDVNRTKLWSPE